MSYNKILIPISNVLKLFQVHSKENDSEIFNKLFLSISIHTNSNKNDWLDEAFWRFEEFLDGLNKYLEEKKKQQESQQKKQNASLNANKYMRDAKKSIPSIKGIK